MSKYTVLIQGPLKEPSASLDAIEGYKKYGEVIISTYTSDLFHENFPREKLKGTKVVSIDLPEIPCQYLRNQGTTFYYALRTMYNGVLQVTTPYLIKTRSDESWSDFSPFINEFKKQKKSLVCGNIFARAFSDFPYHIGDHIFVIKTIYLKKALEYLLSYYDKDQLPPSEHNDIAERTLCLAIMRAMGVNQDRENFLRKVKIVDINKVGKFIARWSKKDITYENKFENHHDVYTSEDL